jgi:hypothetical protein
MWATSRWLRSAMSTALWSSSTTIMYSACPTSFTTRASMSSLTKAVGSGEPPWAKHYRIIIVGQQPAPLNDGRFDHLGVGWSGIDTDITAAAAPRPACPSARRKTGQCTIHEFSLIIPRHISPTLYITTYRIRKGAVWPGTNGFLCTLFYSLCSQRLCF